MRLSIKLLFILFFLLLASSLLVLTPSCSGKSSGGCPNDAAPSGATIVSPIPSGNPPTNAGGTCYPILPFTVKDVNGDPLNGVCVEVYSNGYIAPSTGAPSCNDALVNQQFGFVTRTDSSGNIL